MVKSDIFKGGFIGLLAFTLLFGGFASVAYAQVGPASDCKVRARVTGTETRAITGVNYGVVDPISQPTLPLGGDSAGDNALICAFSLIKWVANVVFAVLISIAILMIAYAAFLFVRSGDDQQTRLKARRVLLWAVVGLIVASIARLIPNIAMSIIVV